MGRGPAGPAVHVGEYDSKAAASGYPPALTVGSFTGTTGIGAYSGRSAAKARGRIGTATKTCVPRHRRQAIGISESANVDDSQIKLNQWVEGIW